MSDDNQGYVGLEATAGPVERNDDIRLTVRLHNPMQRAAHYIAEVRGIAYDEATGRVEVRLTDQGRELVPGALFMEPRFNRVDPGADAQLQVRIPTSIVRMAPTDPPSAEVALQEFEIGPQAVIDVVVGWSDTPFYPDPRERAAGRPTIDEWEQDRCRVTFGPAAE